MAMSGAGTFSGSHPPLETVLHQDEFIGNRPYRYHRPELFSSARFDPCSGAAFHTFRLPGPPVLRRTYGISIPDRTPGERGLRPVNGRSRQDQHLKRKADGEMVVAGKVRERRTETLLDRLPPELVLECLAYLGLGDLARIGRVCRALHAFSRSPSLYLSFSTSGPHSLFLARSLCPSNRRTKHSRSVIDHLTKVVLPHVKRLSLSHILSQPIEDNPRRYNDHADGPNEPFSTFLYPIHALLSSTSCTNLTHLDLSFTTFESRELHSALGQSGLANLVDLNLRGCKSVMDLGFLGRNLKRVERLDLSWTWFLIHDDQGTDDGECGEYTMEEEGPFPNLSHLSISCPNPCRRDMPLWTFLSDPCHFPRNLKTLDLSRNIQLRYRHLENLVIGPNLKWVNLSHCDELTMEDVRKLREGWTRTKMTRVQEERGVWTEKEELDIVHTAVLESDDVVGYRTYVNLVAGRNDADDEREGLGEGSV